MKTAHLTLRQLNSPSGEVTYEVIETRNTIAYRIGEALSQRKVRDLDRIEYTVKGASYKG